MKKLATLMVFIAFAMNAFAQHASHCGNCENPYKKYTQNLPFAMPELKAVTWAAPVMAFTRCSKFVTVGFVMRA